MTADQITRRLEFDLCHPTHQRMSEAAVGFCLAMHRGDAPYTLSFLGGSGAGKTHLAKKISRFFRMVVAGRGWSRERPVVLRGGRVDWRQVCSDVRDGNYGLVRDLQEDYFLALDDVGAEYRTQNQFTDSLLDRIIESRTGQRFTVVCSNLSLAEIAAGIDPRVASRLKREGSVVIDCSAVPDYNFATP